MKHIQTNTLLGFTLILCMIFNFSCQKYQIKHKGCTGNMVITSGSYNSDSVAFYVPNAFTPNKDDMNDCFKIISIGITKMKFRIYKGFTLIYESNSVFGQWDGTINGKIKQGNYRYEAELYSIHDETIKIEGEFSLILPEELSMEPLKHCDSCKFSDMIDPDYGFVYETNERICYY